MESLYSNAPIEWEDYRKQILFDDGNLHIFSFRLDVSAKLTDKFATFLSDAEIEKKNRFFKIEDANRFALGKYFLRKILSEQLSVEPKKINFSLANNNKPYIAEFNFNLSHSGDFVVIAIGKSEIGIDVEQIKTHFDHSSLAKECFTINERNLINNLEDFYCFWTRKEAILKASGEGLIDNLHEIECIAGKVQRHGTNYQLNSFLIDRNHMLSVACENTHSKLFFWNYN